jgi:hypothetical protein
MGHAKPKTKSKSPQKRVADVERILVEETITKRRYMSLDDALDAMEIEGGEDLADELEDDGE